MQIQGDVFADCAVLSRWVNRACVVLTVEQLYVNRFLEQQLKGCSVWETSYHPGLNPHHFSSCTQKLWVWSTWIFLFISYKGAPRVCTIEAESSVSFQNNLMACNKKMSVLLSVQNLTVCDFFHHFLTVVVYGHLLFLWQSLNS